MTEQVIDEIEVVDKTLSSIEVQREIDDIIAELKKRKIAELDVVKPGDYGATDSAHRSGVLEAIAIAFLGALAKSAAETVWKKYIWPSLELRLQGRAKQKRR